MKNRLLLHTCCAPCSTYVVDKLRKDGYDDITAYWYNINIHPFTEYKMRLDTLKQYAEMINLPLVIDYDYGIREFTLLRVATLCFVNFFTPKRYLNRSPSA